MEAPDSVDLDRDVNMERDFDDDEEEDEEEEDEEMDDAEAEVEEKDVDEEEDKDEDDGKEPQTIGWGEMVNTSADNVDIMVGHEPIVLHDQGHEKREHTPSHNLRRMHHGHKPWSLAHDHELRRVIPSVGWSIRGV